MTLRALPIRSPDAKPSRPPQRGPPGDANARELVPVGAAFSVPFLAGQKGDALGPSRCDGCTERISGPIRAAAGWTVRVKVLLPTHIAYGDDLQVGPVGSAGRASGTPGDPPGNAFPGKRIPRKD